MTPAPLDTTTAWTALAWTEIAPDDPLAHVRSMTRWPGGYVALGDLIRNDGAAWTPVWTSSDGQTWDPLEVDGFGPGTFVLGVGQANEGVVAMTLQFGRMTCAEDDPESDPNSIECWTLVGPLRAWTSPDGTSWTAHPGPEAVLADERPASYGGFAQDATGDHPMALMLPGLPLAISDDGVSWQAIPEEALPAGWAGTDATPFGFITFGRTRKTSFVFSSQDARNWDRHDLRTLVGNGGLVSGSSGLILMGLEELPPGLAKWIWWSSLDGRTWHTLEGYPPLGPWTGQEAQECQDACPDGILVGNGERMFAYRGADHAGWTSFDGKAWQKLVFQGRRPTSEPGRSDPMSIVVLPIGVKLHNLDGSFWLGTPIADG